MALRLVEIYCPDDGRTIAALDNEEIILGQWSVDLPEEGRVINVLLDTQDTEAFLDRVQEELGDMDDYRIVLLSVEATVPRPEAKEDEGKDEAKEEENSTSVARISREELYADITESISVTKIFYLLVVLSTVVAAGGMLRDSVAVVIGAMVIAPLIGPNMALALGTTLGDTDLLRRALRVNVVGLLVSLALSVGVGLVFELEPGTSEIASRTEVTLGDMALALAAGVAGALSFTRGISNALIGVMVAVALLPPLVAFGILVGAGHWTAAYGAGLLLATNVASINLAGVVTFLLQGIRPMRWYEEQQAKKATRLAIALWVTVLAILVVAIILAPRDLAF